MKAKKLWVFFVNVFSALLIAIVVFVCNPCRYETFSGSFRAVQFYSFRSGDVFISSNALILLLVIFSLAYLSSFVYLLRSKMRFISLSILLLQLSAYGALYLPCTEFDSLFALGFYSSPMLSSPLVYPEFVVYPETKIDEKQIILYDKLSADRFELTCSPKVLDTLQNLQKQKTLVIVRCRRDIFGNTVIQSMITFFGGKLVYRNRFQAIEDFKPHLSSQ